MVGATYPERSKGVAGGVVYGASGRNHLGGTRTLRQAPKGHPTATAPENLEACPQQLNSTTHHGPAECLSVSVRSWGDRANHSIGWFELDGGFNDMSTKLKILVMYRNRPIFLVPSHYRST